MKLHILSDVHLEFGTWPKQVDVNEIDADVTVLAGDIGIGLEGLEWALTFNRPVIYVMGNHEFYGQLPMNDLWRNARERVENSHVHLLENDEVTINGVRFLGCTLWTDFCILGADRQQFMMNYAAVAVSDYARIFASQRGKCSGEYGLPSQHGRDRLTPRKVLSLHHESRDFLERHLADKVDGKTVVVTHHAPSALSLAHQNATSNVDAAYASHLDALVARADLWVHGHTHLSADYLCHGPGICPGPTRVVSNPRGYIGQEELVIGYNPRYVVEV